MVIKSGVIPKPYLLEDLVYNKRVAAKPLVHGKIPKEWVKLYKLITQATI
jgi:hypothetical protein